MKDLIGAFGTSPPSSRFHAADFLASTPALSSFSHLGASNLKEEMAASSLPGVGKYSQTFPLFHEPFSVQVDSHR